MRDLFITASGAPTPLCNRLNLSYADPPKHHERLTLRCEIHWAAVLQSPNRRSRGASYADSRGSRCVLGGSA
jgi:hypothetical protein